MPAVKTKKNGHIVVSALRVRANFGALLKRVEDQRGSLVIAKRVRPRAILLSIQEYIRLAAPEPEILRIIGEESTENGTNKLTYRSIGKSKRPAGKGRSADALASSGPRHQHRLRPSGSRWTTTIGIDRLQAAEDPAFGFFSSSKNAPA